MMRVGGGRRELAVQGALQIPNRSITQFIGDPPGIIASPAQQFIDHLLRLAVAATDQVGNYRLAVEGEALDMSSVKGLPCDAIFGSSEIVKELGDLDVPVIGIKNILDKQEIEEKFLAFVNSQAQE